MDEIPDDLIDVQPEFAAAIGLSVAEVKALGLRELCDRAFERGFDLTVLTRNAVSGKGRLSLAMETRQMKSTSTPRGL